MDAWSDQDFDAFVADRLPALVSFAYRLTFDLGHAQDLVQTALLSVLMRSRRHRPDSPEPYVRRAIVNAFLSQRRRRTVAEDLVALVPDGRLPHSDPEWEQRDDFQQMVVGLSPRQRAVVMLRYCEDWSDDQVAEALGVSVGTVKKLSARALATLRQRQIAQEGRAS